MKNQNATELLLEAIHLSEIEQAQKLNLLKEQFHITYESFKPVNLIKSTMHDIRSSSEIKNNILSNAIGLATGFLSKKILIGSSHNPIKRLLGTFLQFSVAKVVAKKTDNFVRNDERISANEE